ncbi:MAG: DUF4231 domain-containing protein [Pseudonocardiales bacterium]
MWQQQSLWSQTAGRLKREINRWRSLTLGLTIVGAVLATLGTQVASLSTGTGKVLAWLAAIAVAVTPVTVARAGRPGVQAWTRARSVSEALKSELYTLLAGVSPYRSADREQVLRSRAGKILSDADDLAHHTVDLHPATRTLPAVHDVDSYRTQRVTEQIVGYYRPQARRLQRRLRLIRAAEVILALAVAALSATAAALEIRSASVWVPVGTTLAAAVTAHVAATRYEFLLIEYSRTAAQLERLRDGHRQPTEPGAQESVDDAFVAACERVISIQNEGWMAKLATEST